MVFTFFFLTKDGYPDCQKVIIFWAKSGCGSRVYNVNFFFVNKSEDDISRS